MTTNSRGSRARKPSLSGLRLAVIERDRQCMAAALDRSHQCRNQWGEPHWPTLLDLLTLEHVKKDGFRYDSIDHCMALCSHANVIDHWSDNTENNRLANAYLLGWRVGAGRL